MRARELLGRSDFELLAQELAYRRLLPLIGTRVLEAGGDLTPESFAAAVAAARAAARARAVAISEVTAQVLALLERAGIGAMPLKGPPLAAEIYGDVGMRETADADLLVRPEQLDTATEVLLDAGFAPPTDPRRRDGLPDLHFRMTHPKLGEVELHWRVHWYEREFAGDMLDRAMPGPDGLLHARGDDQAACLLLFYARDGFHGMRHAADVAAWSDRCRQAWPESFLESHTRRYPELAPALTAAAATAERMTGARTTEWLGAAAAAGRRVAVAERLADWTQNGDRDQLAANISFVGGLLGPPGSAREFAERDLLLPGRGALANALHMAKLVVRYGIALWRVRGTRAWAEDPVINTR